MRLAMIFTADPVRHMSVRVGARMRETTDKHGQRPRCALEGSASRDHRYSLEDVNPWRSSAHPKAS